LCCGLETEKAVAFGFVAGDVAGAVGCRFICPVVVALPITLCVWTRCGFVAGFGLDLMAVCCGFEREREREKVVAGVASQEKYFPLSKIYSLAMFLSRSKFLSSFEIKLLNC
jgi:hypothetical protein